MDLGSIMLCEISQTEKDNALFYHLYLESKKKKRNEAKLMHRTKQKQAHRYRKQASGDQ